MAMENRKPEAPAVFEGEITLAAVLDHLDRLLEWVETLLTAHSCPAKTCRQLTMATEEIFVNIAHYAYPGKTGEVTVRAGRAGTAFVLQYEDEGEAFDPLQWPSPDTKAEIKDRGVGGLGIYLIRQLTDQAVYARLEGKNQLTIYSW
jgi:anti-sigma regulatory factor (Ser/Thr protein kinase)